MAAFRLTRFATVRFKGGAREQRPPLQRRASPPREERVSLGFYSRRLGIRRLKRTQAA